MIYTSVRNMDGTANSYNLNFPTKDGQAFNVFVQLGANWAPSNEYNFDPITGAFLSKKLYKDLSAGEKYHQMTGDIHYGWIFG